MRVEDSPVTFEKREEAKTQYAALFRQWCDHHAAVQDAASGPIESDELRDLLQKWWTLSGRLLLATVHVEVHFGIVPEQRPYELLSRLSTIAEDIGNGARSHWLDLATGENGAPPAPGHERRLKGKAVLYLRAVTEDRILDKAPIKTVADAFQVNRQTVRNWLKEKDALASGLPFARKTAEDLEGDMRAAAAEYRLTGRSADAIRTRGKTGR